MSCALLFLTRITGVGACIMLSPTRTREMLSRTRPKGFRVRPNNPRPHDKPCGKDGEDPGEARQTHYVSSLNSFPGQIPGRCGRHIVCPQLLSRAGGGAAATSCGLALVLSRSLPQIRGVIFVER